MSPPRTYRAGESLEDFCRACRTDRMHTVIVVDGDGLPIRVSCGFCHSEHNYRGGPRIGVEAGGLKSAAVRTDGAEDAKAAGSRPEPRPRSQSARDPFPIVSDRERTGPSMPLDPDTDLELLLRRVIREETGITPATPADKWRGGTLVLRPGTAG